MPLALTEFSIQYPLWWSATSYSGDMACPSNLASLKEGVNAGDARPFYDLRVRIFVLPSDVEKSAEATQVDMIELVGVYVSAVHSPGLT